jgi:hypothetical protein
MAAFDVGLYFFGTEFELYDCIFFSMEGVGI